MEGLLDKEFNKAATYIQSVAGNLSSTNLLELYGLYKQSTIGPCNIPKPSFFNIKEKQKWESWNKLGDLNKEEAMQQYITLVTTIDPDWSENEDTKGWVSVSCPIIEPEENLNDDDKTMLDWSKEGNINKVKELAVNQDINQWDENGLTSLHWAADRGNLDMLQCLISLGADINFKDQEGQTALHYASSCGHISAVKLLLSKNADKTITDNEGDTPEDVASSQDIIVLFK